MVGNPNAGKTTLFNSLTGSNQKVGNYPGVTVERIEADLKLEGIDLTFIDVPGLYSLHAVSEDEKVAVEEIQGTGISDIPDLLICVIDSSNLERNLYLYTQVCELNLPVVVALTMVDRVRAAGNEINLELLSSLLGCEVIPIVGHKDEGIDQLRSAIIRNLEFPSPPTTSLGMDSEVERQIESLKSRLSRIGFDVHSSDLRRELLNPSEGFKQYFEDFPELAPFYESASEALRTHPEKIVNIDSRYRWTSMVQSEVISKVSKPLASSKITDRVDFLLTHRVFGLVIFIAVMYLIFQSIYTFAAPIMDVIESAFNHLKEFVGPKLANAPILKSLVVDGIINGIGGVLVFLPQIVILFFFISVLEGTGYLARAAFLMDRLLGWCGLNGRAFIPLLSSFACAIPGIMAARVMPDPKSRLATILVAPLMSCSARLPVYLLLIGAFIQPKFGAFWAGFALFAMHLLGLVVAIPIVWLINRKILNGSRLPFMLELPPYQWPKWKDVLLAMYFRGKVFITTAGTTILLMSIVIWAAGYFPQLSPSQAQQITSQWNRDQSPTKPNLEAVLAEKQLETSVLGRFGKTIEPVFLPAGFDWRISTSILCAFPARETVVPSLGIIFALGSGEKTQETDLRKGLANATWPDGSKLFTPWTAVGLMVFFALCAQCFSTLATVKRETNSWKWPLFMFTYMTSLAWLGAVLIHQLSKGH